MSAVLAIREVSPMHDSAPTFQVGMLPLFLRLPGMGDRMGEGPENRVKISLLSQLDRVCS